MFPVGVTRLLLMGQVRLRRRELTKERREATFRHSTRRLWPHSWRGLAAQDTCSCGSRRCGLAWGYCFP